MAETEKYAHVTFFFNGGREEAFPGEERVLIPSPKVATYDLKPEMSVHAVAKSMAEAVSSGKFDFVMGNLAPPDMVGHTGKFEETVKAVEATGNNACLLACLFVSELMQSFPSPCRRSYRDRFKRLQGKQFHALHHR